MSGLGDGAWPAEPGVTRPADPGVSGPCDPGVCGVRGVMGRPMSVAGLATLLPLGRLMGPPVLVIGAGPGLP